MFQTYPNDASQQLDIVLFSLHQVRQRVGLLLRLAIACSSWRGSKTCGGDGGDGCNLYAWVSDIRFDVRLLARARDVKGNTDRCEG